MERALDLSKVTATIDTLERRIGERFPGASLRAVAQELSTISRETSATLAWLRKPHRGLRACSWLLVTLVILPLLGGLVWMKFEKLPQMAEFVEFLPLLESGLGAIFFLGAILIFLISIETRMKRKRALAAIHELRAIAHIVDMHQLTKDPERTLREGSDTKSSPKRQMTAFELGRYCDYCSEILALAAKIAALYAQSYSDSVVLQAVDEIEGLTSGLSRKLWQKIMILEQNFGREPNPST